MRISACIIMKDEETSVLEMINSIKSHVDEIIVVDTGSIDNSISIVEAQGIRVYPFEWQGSFADARNYSISLATSEWILWIDCDEQLVVPAQYSLQYCLYENNVDFIRCKVINFINDDKVKQDQYIVSQYRLFKRSPHYRFTNDIHEHLDIMHIENMSDISTDCEWVIHHDGYRPTIVEKKNKHTRNISMINNALKKGEDNPWLIYHLASEYYRIGQYSESFHTLNVAVKAFLEKGQYPPSLIYKMKYDILARMSSFQAIIEGAPLVLKLYPDYVDLYYYIGLAYFALEQYEKATLQFHTCIELGEEHVNYLILKGVGSYRSYYYLRECYKMLSNSEREYEYKIKYEEHATDFEPLL